MNNNNNEDVYIISKKENLIEKENRLLDKLKKYKKKLDDDRETNKYEIVNSINRKNNIIQNNYEECPHCYSRKKRELELKTMLESKKKKQRIVTVDD